MNFYNPRKNHMSEEKKMVSSIKHFPKFLTHHFVHW